MKNLLFTLFIMFGGTCCMFAQNSNANYSSGAPAVNTSAEDKAKEATDHLNDLVNLTQDQYNQVLQVNRNFFANMISYGNGRPAAKANFGREQQLKAILNGDQWQTYQNARQQGQAF